MRPFVRIWSWTSLFEDYEDPEEMCKIKSVPVRRRRFHQELGDLQYGEYQTGYLPDPYSVSSVGNDYLSMSSTGKGSDNK